MSEGISLPSSRAWTAAPGAGQSPLGWLDDWARRALVRRVAGLRGGQIALADGRSTSRDRGAHDVSPWHSGDDALEELVAVVQVHEPRFFRDAVLGGSLSVAESYLRGDWDCDDLTTLFRLLLRNAPLTRRMQGPLWSLGSWLARAYHALHCNSRAGSRRNIGAHYDLGNEFFELWLDPTMAYSAGIFTTPESTLEQASAEKFDRICRKLDLAQHHELLEIGTGWGGFALHAAGRYGCQVTTTTISRQQHERARRRIDEAGLAERVTLLAQDYRDLRGSFDRLVAVEMIEAVGARYLDTFCGQLGRLLRHDGACLLQAIVMPDQRYSRYLRSVDFIQRYVFPGGSLPSLGALSASLARSSDLRLVHWEDFSPHYARTLREWRSRFEARYEEVRAQGHTERFMRLWRYYLCYCEAAFAERAIGVAQLVLDKPGCRRDPLELTRAAAGASG